MKIKRKCRNWGSRKSINRRKAQEKYIKKMKELGIEIDAPEEIEVKMENVCEEDVPETRQVLRVKSFTELEDPIRSQNETLVPNPHVHKRLVRILNPKTEESVDKKFVVALNSSGVKFIASTRPQFPGQQPKKVILIRHPKSTNSQIPGKSQLFSLQENSNLKKGVVTEKDMVMGEPLKSKTLVSVAPKKLTQPQSSNKTPVFVTNPISRKEIFTVKNPAKYQVLNPTQTKVLKVSSKSQAESDLETKKIVITRPVSRKEMILFKESREMFQDPIKKKTQNPIISKKEDSLIVGGLILTSTDDTDEPQVPSTSTQFDQISSQLPSTSTQHEPTSNLEFHDLNVSERETYLDFLNSSTSFVDLPNEKPEITSDCQNYIMPHLTPQVIIRERKEEELQFDDSSDPEDFYPCAHCNMEFPAYIELVKHWILLKYHCDNCIQVFSSKPLLKLHLKEAHGIQGYKCTNCNFFESSMWNLKLHILKGHCQEYRHLCEECDRAFKSPEDLQLHVSQAHEASNESTHLCDVCGRAFKNYYTLQCHIGSVHLTRKYPCKQCKKVLFTKPTYARHLRWHKMKNIVCEHCGKRFDIQSDLKVHMRQHTGEKPYICSICSKAFAKRTTLRQHLLIHTGKRPYVCDICGKTFTQKPGLTAHRKSHPGDLPQMPCLFIDEILKKLPDDAFQNLGPKSGAPVETHEEAEEKEDDVVEEDENEDGNEDNAKEDDNEDDNEEDGNEGNAIEDDNEEDGNEGNAIEDDNEEDGNEGNAIEDDNEEDGNEDNAVEDDNEEDENEGNAMEDDIEDSVNEKENTTMQEEIEETVNSDQGTEDVTNDDKETEDIANIEDKGIEDIANNEEVSESIEKELESTVSEVEENAESAEKNIKYTLKKRDMKSKIKRKSKKRRNT